MKVFLKRLGNFAITLVAISMVIVVMNVFFDSGRKELCGRLNVQKVEHETKGLYPDFFISQADKNTCSEIGYNF